MSGGARKLALTVHIGTSVGWLGALGAYLLLDVTVATATDAQVLRAGYLGMALIAGKVIVPLAIAALATGLLVSLGTKWGLFRHYWVIVSLVLTTIATVVLLIEMQVVLALARTAVSATDEQLRALGHTLPHSIGGGLVLVFVLALNMYKPRGLTPYGWRKEQGRRRV